MDSSTSSIWFRPPTSPAGLAGPSPSSPAPSWVGLSRSSHSSWSGASPNESSGRSPASRAGWIGTHSRLPGNGRVSHRDELSLRPTTCSWHSYVERDDGAPPAISRGTEARLVDLQLRNGDQLRCRERGD